MKEKIILEQKRICFQGRGAIARALDRVFFAILSGLCLYIACGKLWLSVLMSASILLLQVALAKKRWTSYVRTLRKNTEKQLRQENWMEEEAVKIHAGGERILYPEPNGEELTG